MKEQKNNLIPISEDVERRFNQLAEQWKEETEHSSNICTIVHHPSYQQIIGIGPQAIPFILGKLERQIDFWYWALTMISGEDPVPEEARGNVEVMRRYWLNWGRERKYIK
jgi:hypothetical protein